MTQQSLFLISQFHLINRELEKVSNWFKANKLSVNASKTNFMLLGTHNTLSCNTGTHKILKIFLIDENVTCTIQWI